MIGFGVQLIQEYQAFWVGRAIAGFSFGVSNAVSPMFIAEIAPKNLKGPLMAMVQIWFNLGLLIPLSMNFLLPVFIRPDSTFDFYCLDLEGKYIVWREILAVPILVALIQI